MKGLVARARAPPCMEPLPLPSLTAFHDVIVRVSAVSLAHTEYLAIRHNPLDPGARFNQAHYFAGRVAESKDKRFVAGERVLGFAESGLAAAQFVGVAGFRLEKIPDRVNSDSHAAAIAYDGFVAVRAFQSFERKENFVLILGADSHIGVAASAWARFALNTRVHAVCRDSAKITSLKPGPTRILEMNRGQPWNEALNDVKYDFILDCIGGHSVWVQAKHLLRSGGTFVSIYGDMFDPPKGISHIASEAMTDLFRNFKASVSPGIGAKYEVFNTESTPYSISQAISMLQSTQVQIPSFSQEFSLDQISEFLESDPRSIRPVLNL
jgi:NADPH:quinone reductase-like Zn-dependent oxidoreductase